jgi:CheY-like chemotaxis protein
MAFPVLLAEDNQDDVWLWVRALKGAGLEDFLFIVPDGAEAIAYLAGDGVYADRSRYPFPSLLLLDLSMPRRNGFDVLEWWGSAPRPQALSIIVLTGAGLRDDIERAYKLGAAYHVAKPAELEEVTVLARRALEFWRRRRGPERETPPP